MKENNKAIIGNIMPNSKKNPFFKLSINALLNVYINNTNKKNVKI